MCLSAGDQSEGHKETGSGEGCGRRAKLVPAALRNMESFQTVSAIPDGWKGVGNQEAEEEKSTLFKSIGIFPSFV